MAFMNETEKELVDYLNSSDVHLEPIRKSLRRSLLHYDYIKVLEVSIGDEEYEICIETFKNSGGSVSVLPLPKKFLRKLKLEQLKQLNK